MERLYSQLRRLKPSDLAIDTPHDQPSENRSSAGRTTSAFPNEHQLNLRSMHSLLPYEVLRRLTQFCDFDTLAKLCRVDTQTKISARLQLYRHIYLSRVRIKPDQPFRYDSSIFGTKIPISRRSHRLLLTAKTIKNLVKIQSLDIELPRDTYLLPGIFSLMNRLDPDLTALRIDFREYDVGLHLHSSGLNLSKHLPRLGILVLANIQGRSLPCILTLGLDLPELQTLVIDVTVDDLRRYHYIRPPVDLLGTGLTYLENLHLKYPGERLPLELLEVLQDTISLRKLVLSITGSVISRSLQFGIDIWKILGAKKHLKSLAWQAGTMREICYQAKRSGGFDELRDVLVGVDNLRTASLLPKVH
jgi:hypothetical protein